MTDPSGNAYRPVAMFSSTFTPDRLVEASVSRFVPTTRVNATHPLREASRAGQLIHSMTSFPRTHAVNSRSRRMDAKKGRPGEWRIAVREPP